MNTTLGSICSIALFIIAAGYAYQKMDVWLHKKEVNVMAATQKNYFTDDFEFTYEMGMNFALAFTAYDEETEYILDPSYGNIVFIREAWGEKENGEYYWTFDEIPSHTCTKEELGFGDNSNKSRFMPIPDDQVGLVKKYQKKFKCLSPEYLKISGNANS